MDIFLRQYNEKEKKFLNGNPCSEDKVYQKYEEMGEDNGSVQKTYLFKDDYFLSSYENIGINRQDRFQPVFPHRHNYIELNYIWSGSCTQVINGKKVEYAEGDVCILDTQTTHSVAEAGDNDIIVNILMRKEFFAAAFFNRMTRQGILAEFLMNAIIKGQETKQYLFFETGHNPRFRSLMENILGEYYGNDLGKREVMESYIIILFTELLRSYRENPSHNTKNQKLNRKLFDILEYIENNYESCSLKTVAGHFGFNEKYLTMFLKKRTGRSFVEHLQEQKLGRAKMLLLNTELPVTEVITRSGYNNTNFFYKIFQESEGCTPGDYRERQKPII